MSTPRLGQRSGTTPDRSFTRVSPPLQGVDVVGHFPPLAGSLYVPGGSQIGWEVLVDEFHEAGVEVWQRGQQENQGASHVNG